MIDREIFVQALATWGAESLVIIAMEEMGELIVALSHKYRGREVNVAEEIADVQISLDQLKIIFGEDNVDEILEEKMDRLKERLLKSKNSKSKNPFDYDFVNNRKVTDPNLEE